MNAKCITCFKNVPENTLRSVASKAKLKRIKLVLFLINFKLAVCCETTNLKLYIYSPLMVILKLYTHSFVVCTFFHPIIFTSFLPPQRLRSSRLKEETNHDYLFDA